MEQLKKFMSIVGFSLLCIIALALTSILVSWPYLICQLSGKTPCIVASLITVLLLIVCCIFTMHELDGEWVFIPVAYVQAVVSAWLLSGAVFLIYSTIVNFSSCL